MQLVDPPVAVPQALQPVEILPDIHPMSGMPKNYRVELAKFGGYDRGKIVPKSVLVRSGGEGVVGREDEYCANLVRARKFTQTYDPVNVEISYGTCAPISSGGSTVAEVKDLELKVTSLRDQMDGMIKDRDGWKAQAGSRDTTIMEQGKQIQELQAAMAAKDKMLESQQGEIRKLTDTLDAATKPKGAK